MSFAFDWPWVGLWTMRVGLRAGIGSRGVGAIILGGVLTHAVLMGSLLAFLQGWLAAPVLAHVQILNMAVPLTVALIVCGAGAASRDRNRRPVTTHHKDDRC